MLFLKEKVHGTLRPPPSPWPSTVHLRRASGPQVPLDSHWPRRLLGETEAPRGDGTSPKSRIQQVHPLVKRFSLPLGLLWRHFAHGEWAPGVPIRVTQMKAEAVPSPRSRWDGARSSSALRGEPSPRSLQSPEATPARGGGIPLPCVVSILSALAPGGQRPTLNRHLPRPRRGLAEGSG